MYIEERQIVVVPSSESSFRMRAILLEDCEYTEEDFSLVQGKIQMHVPLVFDPKINVYRTNYAHVIIGNLPVKKVTTFASA